MRGSHPRNRTCLYETLNFLLYSEAAEESCNRSSRATILISPRRPLLSRIGVSAPGLHAGIVRAPAGKRSCLQRALSRRQCYHSVNAPAPVRRVGEQGGEAGFADDRADVWSVQSRDKYYVPRTPDKYYVPRTPQ